MCFDVNVLDDDFNLVSTVLGEDGHTQQGMECDGDYIYCLQSSIRHNYIWCYTWEGEFVKKILLPPVGEAEHLFIHGDKLIIGGLEYLYTPEEESGSQPMGEAVSDAESVSSDPLAPGGIAFYVIAVIAFGLVIFILIWVVRTFRKKN